MVDEQLEHQYTRLPPSNREAEMCLLGSLLIMQPQEQQKILAQLCSLIGENSFYYSENRIIWKITSELIRKNKPIDAVILHAELKQVNLLEEIGGAAYIAEVLNSVPSAAHALHYAQIVHHAAKRRSAIIIANDLVRKMYDLRDDDIDQYISSAAEKLFDLRSGRGDLDFWTLADAVEDFLASRSEQNGAIRCGISEIDDDYTGLFARGCYTLVAGRPSMGKSTFVRWLLSRFAEQGISCGLIAIEETKNKIAANYLSAYSGIENRIVTSGKLTEQQEKMLSEAADKVRVLPIVATDGALRYDQVMAAFDYLVHARKCSVIAIDHLHLLHLADQNQRRENRHQEITLISAGLKNAIKKTGVVGIVVCQLRRSDPTRARRPSLDDLRESGSLEEHADAVILLHREDYYHVGDREYQRDHQCQVIIPKLRNGRTGWVALREELDFQRFAEDTGTVDMELF